MESDSQNLVVYLSGEIHTDWRKEIAEGIRRQGLSIKLSGPVTDHAASDDCGVNILGAESDSFWKDRKRAGIDAGRTPSSVPRA
nr:YtoQ family protein [Planctomycetota bacterium]